MATLIEQLLIKVGLRGDVNMLEKTTELVRLLELRSINVPLQINEYGKILICIDIAANLIGISYDKEQALKLSGLRKSHYINNKRMFEKLLDVNKLMGVKDICIQLDLSQVNKKAEELLDRYRKIVENEILSDIDFTHPQYAAMAVFMACKLCKQKVSKSKIMSFSNLRPSQWQQLEQRWEKFIAKHCNDVLDSTLKKQNLEVRLTLTDNDRLKENDGTDRKRCTEVEDYENWKKRILAMAQAKLKEQSVNSKDMEDIRGAQDYDFTDVIDNMILGC